MFLLDEGYTTFGKFQFVHLHMLDYSCLISCWFLFFNIKILCSFNFLEDLFFSWYSLSQGRFHQLTPLLENTLNTQILIFYHATQEFSNLPKLYFLEILLWTVSRIHCCTFVIYLLFLTMPSSHLYKIKHWNFPHSRISLAPSKFSSKPL